MQSLQKQRIRRKRTKTDFHYYLDKIFGEVGLTLITQSSKKKGIWKLGKTNLGLYLSQILLKYGIVHEVATNINTFGHYPQVADLYTLRAWLFRNRFRKLYIFDELNVHAPRRRAMSNKNIGILQVFPEISKARARIIGIGHELLKTDKDLMSYGIVRALFIKTSLKNARLISHLFKGNKNIPNLPATTIKYDPYETAPFTERPLAKFMFKDEDLQKFYNWAKGGTWRSLFSNPNECNRFVRRMSLRLLEKAFTDLQP